MADQVLSQAEVDALMRGVSDGTVETKPSETDKAGVRPCDLTSQERIIRERMPTLELINERFARLFRETLFGVLRKTAEILPESAQAMKFSEFIKKIPLPSSINLVKMEPLRGQILLVLEPKLIYMLLDHLFGGKGQTSFKTEGREFTPIEQRFIRKVVDHLLKDLQKAWTPVHPVKFEWVRSEMNPQLTMVVAPTEATIAITIKVEIDGQGGLFRLCLPYPTIEPIREKLHGGFTSDQPEVDRSWIERFKKQLEQCHVNLNAELGSARLTIREVLQLKTKDVIVLDKNVDGDVVLRVEGRPKYLGRFGLYRSGPAFQVTSIVREPKEDPYGD